MGRKKTDDELKNIAVDIYDGKIFHDQMVKSPQDLPMVFMPLILGAFNDFTEDEKKDTRMLYEYVDKAGPRLINGMPNFSSFNILFKDDFEMMITFFEEYKKLKESFLE